MPETPENIQNSQQKKSDGFTENHKLEIRELITRETVRAEKDKIFLFGDNLLEQAFGGQAAEMRGEENAIGIPTKKAPSNVPNSFFTDKELAANKNAIDEAFGKIPPGKIIVIPKAGLGTGLAQLEEKAPQTFTYLNEKLARIGFSNPNKETSKDLTLKSSGENKVIVQSAVNEPPSAKRLLDLNNIQTASLKILSPTEKEIDALKASSKKALADYADRLREGYKNNTDNFRDGLRILNDSLEKGEQITIACACRGSGAMCHADVVKMAVEKVGAHIKNGQESEKGRNDILESRSSAPSNSVKQSQVVSPRTQRAINEILSHSENDRILEKINDSDGRNRSEQASYLGRVSQFARDIYERGGQLVEGNLIVPQEKLTLPEPLAITTQDYAVSRIGKILHDESKAKELAPVVVEYGNKIVGLTADGETKLKVFGWIYDSLEGKSETSEREENNSFGEKLKFDETLEKIRVLAEEMRFLEPLDKIEFVPLAELEQSYKGESFFDEKGENLNFEEIYEEAISHQANEKQFYSIDEKGEQFLNIEPDRKISAESYERIELANTPRIPEDFTKAEITRFVTEILPEIDRQIESGTPPKEILAPFAQAVSRSAKDDAQNRLESIYRKQQSNKDEVKQFSDTRNSNQKLEQEPTAKIDLRRQNIIELKTPGEYLSAEKEAINTFYRRQRVEVGNLLTKIDEIREYKSKGGEKTQEIALKKELNQIREAKPNFAFKLENSAEIVVGKPSSHEVERQNFVSSYINYQLKQPETRLRFENVRYRIYAAKLESAATRDDVMKFASEIRAENAALGLKWKDLEMSEKAKRARPLTGKEMQFLFTESSPAHYTGAMTAARLSYAHSGASRRQMTESLLKGEIIPSPEAHKLIESLESRLQRRELKDSLLATRHFFESIKSPEKELKYKNSFDHREIYQKLPPQEKDFVYHRATEQKENLEYRLVFKKQQLDKGVEIGRIEKGKSQTSQAEKSFHLNSWFNQARILGDKVEQPAPSAQKEISERDCTAIAVLLNNQPIEKLENIAAEFQKSENPKNKKIGEVVQTFARAEIYQSENKTVVSIKLPKSKLVGVENYRELLEKFYPDDARENEKYKFEKFGEKEVFGALQKGQDEAINNLREEIKDNSYQTGAPANISEVEESVLEKLDKIAQLQTEARRALRENKSILGKYVARAVGAQIQNQKAEIPSPNNQKEIVNLALGGKSSNPASNKIHDQFLQAAQKEITISDFQKFSANESFLDEMKANIKSEFAEISEGLKVLEVSKLHSAKVVESTEKEQNISANTANRELVENKPFTLRLFEKELEKAEKGLLGASLKEKLSPRFDLEKENNLNRASLFSNEERTAIKAQAFEVVKEKLEPKELNADNRALSPEASRQAFATYKQLERASNLLQTSDDKSKITEAFSKLDREAFQLNQIRQDYNRDEKMALLRDGIKSDLVDWFKKNSETKQAGMEGQINKILTNNLKQFDITKLFGDQEQIGVLSRQIVEKIETKQILAVKDKGMSADSRENVNPSKNHHSFRNETGKTNLLEKVKEAPVFTR